MDSTTARAHHDAAGMHLGEDVLTALGKAGRKGRAEEQTGRTPKPIPHGKSGDAFGAGADPG